MWLAQVFSLLLIAVVTVSSSPDCTEPEEFRCDDGTCIGQNLVCDGRVHCPDNSDEKNCDFKLCRKPNWFKCSDNKTCITKELVCDRNENCPHGDDEKDCFEGSPASKNHTVCDKFQFTCSDKTCVPLDMICDGKNDCEDGSDETIGCIGIESKCRGYLCKNKHCLENEEWVCDGEDDCGDGSDESACENNCRLENRKFFCKNHSACIPLEKVCDNITHCSDGSDENGLCNLPASNCSSLHCPNECRNLPSGPICLCRNGWKYNKNLNTCEDVNECEEYGTCSQGCINTNGSYYCTCIKGFHLQKDGKKCLVQSGEPLLLYTTQKSVVGVFLESHHLFSVARNLSQVIGVSYDGNFIYWTDIKHGSESIVRSHQDGSNQEILLTSGLEAPEDLAVDWLTGNIYFTDNILKHIAVCSNHAYHCLVLITHNIDQPRGIVLHPHQGIMFWTDWGQKPMIGRAAMDGSGSHTFVKNNLGWPNGLVLDIPNDRLYWVDAKGGTIESIHLNGSDRRVILSHILKHPYGISVFENKIYWSDWGTSSIHSCEKFTGKHHEVVLKDRAIYDIHIYHSAIQPKGAHPCLKHNCSHLCLLASNKTRTCACPEGMALSLDLINCIKMVKKQLLYLGVGNFLVRIQHTSFGRHSMAEGIPLHIYIHKMAFNSRNGTIFIADNVQRVIYEIDPKTKVSVALVRKDLGNVSALSYDHLGHNLYWSDSDRQTIEVLSLRNKQRAIVTHFTGMDTPIAIAVVPEIGKMYVVLKSFQSTHIDIQSMHGRGHHHHIAEQRLGNEGYQLIVNPEAKAVFWLDSGGNKIEFSNYDGTFRHVFRTKLKHPVSMTFIDDDIAWSLKGSRKIFWTPKAHLASLKSFEIDKPPYISFPDEVILLATKPLYIADHQCQHDNGGCSHVCVPLGDYSSGCLCPPGLVFKDKMNRTCIESWDCEFRCGSGECLTASRRCNGHNDCIDGSDELGCKTKELAANQKVCSYSEFLCHDSTQCIPQDLRCDQNFDCEDKSDEEDCANFDHSKKCHKYQHACKTGRCIDLTQLCDGFDDCGDNSDEISCEKDTLKEQKMCGPDLFRCTTGQCIAKDWECDGYNDCTDSSDEHDKCTPKNCPHGFKKCKLGHCIDAKLLCDGHNDCGDNSDEVDCDLEIFKTVCKEELDHAGNPTKFHCLSNVSICLDISVKCDGKADCPRGEDEIGCLKCDTHDFECETSKECIRLDFRCDKKVDCSDGSDENGCNNYNATSYSHFTQDCHDDMFNCSDGTCIDMLRVCDGFPDCKKGQDETDVCRTACIDHPCDQKCIGTPHGPICSCSDGYMLNSDKRTCGDVNECRESKPCAQICENAYGSYRCSCYAGFMLRSDKTSCKAFEGEHYLLFSTYNQVRKLSENPIALKIMWNIKDTQITGLDVNVHQQVAYFTAQDSSSLYEFNLKNETFQSIADVGRPEKLAVDWSTNNIYFIDHSDYPSIKVCHFSTKSACVYLIKLGRMDIIKAIAVDAYNKLLFYSVLHHFGLGNPQSVIYRTRLDGSKPQILVSKAVHVSALECDIYKKILYYTDTDTKTLKYINYDGGESQIIIKHNNAIHNPTGLSIHENVAFIINTGSPDALRCQLYGHKKCQAFALNVYNAEDIVVVAPSRQKFVTNVCKDHNCTLICVQADLGPKCLCHSGQYVQPGIECKNESLKGVGLRVVNKSPITATIQKKPKTGSILAVLFMLILLFVSAYFVYFYYKKRRGHKIFNLNMHFQNPLSKVNILRTSGGSGHIRMCKPLQKNSKSDILLDSKAEGMISLPGTSHSILEDSDSESAKELGNFNDNPRARLVL